MSEKFDLILRGDTTHTPDSSSPEGVRASQSDVAIKDGRIAKIGLTPTDEAETIFDATGLDILPGLLDTQVHFREPGLEHKETLKGGSLGAVAGGVTAVFEMPNTKPSTTTLERFDFKVQRAQETMWCDFAFYAGGSPENIDNLPLLEQQPFCSGVKIFMGSSTGSLLVSEDEMLDQILSKVQRRVSVHCEDEARLIERFSIVKDCGDPAMHPVWRDEQTAIQATKRIVGLARKNGKKVHTLHITTAEELDFLRDNKDIATVECLPQHLTLSAPECYERLGTKAQMNPPIRESRHRDALWKAIADGTIDVLGSDHAPHTLEEKSKSYPNTPSGMTGVQTIVPVMLNHINSGRLSLARLTQLMAHNPKRIWGLKDIGSLEVGARANITVVDMKKQKTIEDSWIQSIAGWTPYHGVKVKGWPIATLVGGQFAMREDQILAKPNNQGIQFSN